MSAVSQQTNGFLSPQPWRGLPPTLATLLRPTVPELVEETTAEFHAIGDYDELLEGPFGKAIRFNSELMLSRFLDLIADPETDDSEARRHYVAMGQIEYRQGRSLDALMASYRLMGRLAWRRFTAIGADAGIDPGVLYQLGEALFAYIDGLSAESVEGFAEAQVADAGEREQARRDLIAALRRRPPASLVELGRLAERAAWPAPTTAAAVATTAVDEQRLGALLGPDALLATVGDAVVALVPDPAGPGRRRRLERALKDVRAAIGPAAPWSLAGRSIERALLAERLLASGRLDADGGPVAAEKHLVTLLLEDDRELSVEIAERHLAPLADLPAGPRARLTQTLRVWLDHRGRTEEVASRLGVHPQTVRYRLNQLRELFGDSLDDPEQRLAIGLALRVSSGG